MTPGAIRTLALLTGLGLIGLAASLAGNTPALVWVIGLGLLWSVFQLLAWRTPSLPPPAPVASPSPATPDVLAAIARLSPLIDIRTVFRSTAAVLAESLNADFCLLYDVDSDEGQLRQSEPRGPRISLADRPDLRALLEQDSPLAIRVADAKIHPADRALLQDHGVAQALNVPMRLNGQAVGLARLLFTRERAFDDGALAAASRIADQAAQSIHNARAVHIIAEDRERLAAVLNATHDGVLLLDPSGRVLLTNPRLEAYWGIRGYRLYGLPLADLLDDPELQLGERLGLARAELDDLVRTIRAGLALNFTRVEFTSRLPRVRHFERTGAPVLDGLDRALGWVIVLRDITEERELQQVRDSLSSMIVHDLRGPLAAIQTGLMFVRDRMPGESLPPLALQAIELALRSCNRMLGLVNTLLDIAKMESGELHLQRRPTALASVVAEVSAELEPLARDQGLSIVNDLAADLPLVALDPEKLTRVIANLVDNALKFTPTGGVVRIVADLSDGQSEIRVGVLDSGPGIPDDYRARIFDRFVQVSGRRGARAGSGLGLSFCKLTVEAHGGRIWAENLQEGGSGFYFTLPTD